MNPLFPQITIRYGVTDWIESNTVYSYRELGMPFDTYLFNADYEEMFLKNLPPGVVAIKINGRPSDREDPTTPPESE